MRRSAALLGLLLLAGGALLGSPPSVDAEDLRIPLGEPHVHVMEPRTPRWGGQFDVPADAEALHVVVIGREDVDLYVKRGRRPAGALPEDADASSRGSSRVESIRLGLRTSPALKPGRWYVVVENPRAATVGVRFEITVLVDRPGTPRTLLPGSEELLRLEGKQPSAALRTVLPDRARSVVFDLEGAEDRGITYDVQGPNGTGRVGRSPRRIVISRVDSPSGVYTLSLTRAPGASPPLIVRARVIQVFEDGREMSAGRDPVLRPGAPLTVGLGGDWHPVLRRVQIPVTEEMAGFEVEVSNGAGADVDLYLRRGTPIAAGDQDADYLAVSTGPRERLVVGGMKALAKGTYFLEVVLVDGCGPISATLDMRVIPLRSGQGTWGTKEPPLLTAGRWVSGRVASGLPGAAWFRVRVPAGTRSLHAVLHGAEAPLDMVLVRRTDGSIMRRALTPRVDERIDHVFSTPPDTPRHFVIGVLNRNPGEPQVGFRLTLAFDQPPGPPPDVTWPPVMRLDKLTAVERAAAATVEITVRGDGGGSGACVTPRGRILTCRHVLETGQAGGAIQRKGILIAFPSRMDTAPTQSFLARLVHEDAEKDLALLEITADVFGRPLPSGAALPTVELGQVEGLRLGAPVKVAGYPAQGSARSRTPVIVTRGTVAGLERRAGALRWIKTDAWIGLGHSGGCVLDGANRLVGIAAATLGPREVLGLAVPVSALPSAWLPLIRSQPPK